MSAKRNAFPFMPGPSQSVTVSNTATTVALLQLGSPSLRIANLTAGTVNVRFGQSSTVTASSTDVAVLASNTAVFTKPFFLKTSHVSLRSGTAGTVIITEGDGE